MTIIVVDEQPGAGRLGRHVEHDPASRAFAIAQATEQLRTVSHRRHVPIFDQGDLGSCTGNAAAGAMGTGPWTHTTDEQVAIYFYERATHLDRIKGVYPPDDTGSSGLAVMKAVREQGWISSYRHCFSLHAVLTALQATPVVAGINWYESFDRPGLDGRVHVTGDVRGGHELCLTGVDIEAGTIRAANSWGAGWGDHGYLTFVFADFDRLLHEHGDVTVPVP